MVNVNLFAIEITFAQKGLRLGNPRFHRRHLPSQYLAIEICPYRTVYTNWNLPSTGLNSPFCSAVCDAEDRTVLPAAGRITAMLVSVDWNKSLFGFRQVPLGQFPCRHCMGRRRRVCLQICE
jgi:hypothetical protein